MKKKTTVTKAVEIKYAKYTYTLDGDVVDTVAGVVDTMFDAMNTVTESFAEVVALIPEKAHNVRAYIAYKMLVQMRKEKINTIKSAYKYYKEAKGLKPISPTKSSNASKQKAKSAKVKAWDNSVSKLTPAERVWLVEKVIEENGLSELLVEKLKLAARSLKVA